MKTCPDCGGDGGWEIPYAMDHVTGTPLTKWRWCQTCNAEDEHQAAYEQSLDYFNRYIAGDRA
jgi:hypothetical protein